MVEFWVGGQPRPRGSKTAMPIYDRSTGYVRVRNRPVIRNGKVIKYAIPIFSMVDAAKGSDKWMQAIKEEAQLHAPPKPWECAVTLSCSFAFILPATYRSTAKGKTHLPRPSAPPHKITQPDTTKLMRGVEDALSGIIYKDDNVVVSQSCTKSWEQFEGVLVRVWPEAPVISIDEDIRRLIAECERKKPF